MSFIELLKIIYFFEEEKQMKKSVVLGVTAVALLSSFSYATFSDVPSSAWYHDAVKYVSENKILNGVGDNMFAPAGKMTRAMIVQALYNMEEEPDIIVKNLYDDVEIGKWYENAISWGVGSGIVKGVGNNKFSPNSYITKEQMITILHNYAKYKKYDVSVGEDTNILSYNDALDLSEYAFEPMQWACGAKIIVGSDGNLLPKKELTRAEVATIIKNFKMYYARGSKAWVELEGNVTTGYVWSASQYDKNIVEVSDYEYTSPQDDTIVGQPGKFKFEMTALKEGSTEVIFRYARQGENAIKTIVCGVIVDSNGTIQLVQRGNEDVKSFIVQSRLANDKTPDYDARLIKSIDDLKAYKETFNMDDFLFNSITTSFTKYDEKYFENNWLAVITKKDSGKGYEISSVDKIGKSNLEVTLNSYPSEVDGGTWYVFVELPVAQYGSITSVSIAK